MDLTDDTLLALAQIGRTLANASPADQLAAMRQFLTGGVWVTYPGHLHRLREVVHVAYDVTPEPTDVGSDIPGGGAY